MVETPQTTRDLDRLIATLQATQARDTATAATCRELLAKLAPYAPPPTSHPATAAPLPGYWAKDGPLARARTLLAASRAQAMRAEALLAAAGRASWRAAGLRERLPRG